MQSGTAGRRPNWQYGSWGGRSGSCPAQRDSATSISANADLSESGEGAVGAPHRRSRLPVIIPNGRSKSASAILFVPSRFRSVFVGLARSE
jgi:hypothetical protein